MKFNVTPQLVVCLLKRRRVLHCWHSAVGRLLTKTQCACNAHLPGCWVHSVRHSRNAPEIQHRKVKHMSLPHRFSRLFWSGVPKYLHNRHLVWGECFRESPQGCSLFLCLKIILKSLHSQTMIILNSIWWKKRPTPRSFHVRFRAATINTFIAELIKKQTIIKLGAN